MGKVLCFVSLTSHRGIKILHNPWESCQVRVQSNCRCAERYRGAPCIKRQMRVYSVLTVVNSVEQCGPQREENCFVRFICVSSRPACIFPVNKPFRRPRAFFRTTGFSVAHLLAHWHDSHPHSWSVPWVAYSILNSMVIHLPGEK